MKKVSIGTAAFLYPMPMVIVGANVDGMPNYLAVAWVCRTNFNPPMIGIALSKTHHTNKGIRTHREFSVNIPSADMLAVTDYTGIMSGAKTDKSGLFTPIYGTCIHAPMIEECPLSMECRVTSVVELPSNEFFIGEIIHAYCREDCLTEGVPDAAKLQPFTLTMPDNRYWALGAPVGAAWRDGRMYKP